MLLTGLTLLKQMSESQMSLIKATLSLFTQNNFKTPESICFFGSEVTCKNQVVGRMNRSVETWGQRWKMWGLFDQAKMRELMAAKIQRPKRLCSVTQEETQCLWTPGLLTVTEKCFLMWSRALPCCYLKIGCFLLSYALMNWQILSFILKYVCLVFKLS